MRLVVPEGFRVEREDHADVMRLSVYEEGVTRALVSVGVYPPRVGLLGRGPQINWSLAPDYRPEVAVALAYALGLAAWYVDRADGWFDWCGTARPVDLEDDERSTLGG